MMVEQGLRMTVDNELRTAKNLIDAQTVGHNMTITQLAEVRIELEGVRTQFLTVREFLHRVRNNPLASFFLSSGLCDAIDKFLGRNVT